MLKISVRGYLVFQFWIEFSDYPKGKSESEPDKNRMKEIVSEPEPDKNPKPDKPEPVEKL